LQEAEDRRERIRVREESEWWREFTERPYSTSSREDWEGRELVWTDWEPGMDSDEFGWIHDSDVYYEDAQTELYSNEDELWDALSELSQDMEPVEATRFLEYLPQEVVSNLIWPKLVYAEAASGICMAQEAHLRQIQVLTLLSRVCKSWKEFVSGSYEWEYGIVNYIENYLSLENAEDESSDSESW
jgi:transglutaminase-like putative cysteine protease